MKTALRSDTRKEISPHEADATGLSNFICPSCGEIVKLFRGNVPWHFEHLPSKIKCALRDQRDQRP
jgi:competence CoiA-like predicted nuclease